MLENIYYSSLKEFKTDSNSVSQTKGIIPFSNFHIFFGFADGHWVLFESLKNQKVNEGKVKGNSTNCLTLFHNPRALDETTIVFVNRDLFLLNALNPYTGELHTKWKHEVPTVQGLPLEYRSDALKVDKAYAGLDIQVLKKSRIVGVLERIFNTSSGYEFFITVFRENSDKMVAQIKHSNSEQAHMKLRNGDDENTFVLYSTMTESSQNQSYVDIYVLNIKSISNGLQKIRINTEAPGTFFALYPWGNGQIALFGNPNKGGIPNQIIQDFDGFTQKNKEVSILCNINTRTTLLKNVFSVDPDKNRVLLMESNKDGTYVGIWNSALNKLEFSREVEKTRQIVSSTNNLYFVEFINNHNWKETSMKFVVSRLVTKKMLCLHMMKHAIYKNRPLVEIHGKADVLRDVANML